MGFKFRILFFLLLGLSLAGAAEEHGGHAEAEAHPPVEVPAFEGRVFQIGDTGPDIKVPSAVWDLIQGEKSEQNLTFAPIKVHLAEKTKGVLIEPEIMLVLPRGGGEVDLAKFVRDIQGTFRVSFEFEELKEGKDLQIFFVSKARKRKLDGEIWGAGCRKFMDIKDFILKGKNGIEVNTTRHRHLSVLGGHFIFAAKHQVTQVTFKDSTQTQLFCDEIANGAAKSESPE